MFLGQSSPASLQVKKLASWQELEALRPVWNEILRISPRLTLFSTPEWLGAWWQAYGRGKHLVALVFTDANAEIAGLIPLYLDPQRHALGPKRLRLVGDGSGDSDNLDFIIRPGYENVCTARLLDWLRSESGWDICELNTLPASSVSSPWLLRHLNNRDWVQEVQKQPCAAIDLPETWDAYLQQLSQRQRQNIRYYQKRLERAFQVKLRRCEHQRELPLFLETLFELHQKRWESRGQPGAFSSSNRRSFYHELSAALLDRKWLELWFLELNGKPAGAHFAFRFGDTVFYLQGGFDLAYESYSIGILFTSYLLREFISQGVRRYDFLGGADSYKSKWKSTLGTYDSIHIARSMSRGALHLQAARKILLTKQWILSNLSSSVSDILRRGYRAICRDDSANS